MKRNAWILPAMVVVEGIADEAIVNRLLAHIGLTDGWYRLWNTGGKTKILSKLQAYNLAARRQPWFVLLDLDSAACAPTWLSETLPVRSEGMCLRLAVRQVESWLLADKRGVSEYLGVPSDVIPERPDDCAHAKREMLALAARGKHRRCKEMIIKRQGAILEGPLYTFHIQQFATDHWDIDLASTRSESLSRALAALRRWVTLWHLETGV
ncbi:hypothetical protein [Alicyclobacillus macrosporangiidus]|uniref:DUF4276 family protein n=1 Tax=Alicyclobacillus macrosporangiidus TaxID=392015 RepID=A0A1I7HRP7_9BACL|nr:hypothetical protein [Alicyclobacillus macrosporangiidus]SFU63408.1 hypothetical protein SAMN05421543_10567 [Alicyclobacillus macrosporangiidus]